MPDVELKAEIGVGSLVQLRTEFEYSATYVVVKVGKWWRRGQVCIRHLRHYNYTDPEKCRWVYPCEVELVNQGGS